ncbi:DNA polymerase III subunit gamma/tau [Pollutimonas subterranea]|uniref:DNA polymerase III subunit gamma/tau n=1 Tax=Pollutimonas subterranea TaxID=2045210 RepID=A0A2N4U8T1_9BURK|nr:DNA polymerase III subunit gamma/tau [Pollutimonas subterranea]PLC51427.1 DNA polymerase III subunit gamma/tau [Pollutimonas subterranea]
MTYLVLARKWRPRSFDTLIGQDHVVRALTHALSTQRLHHAWLFTGTRGVGKTTLSRILAKSLNCETGITATPCGTCRACTEIDTGRFVDYVELDAASNRGVEEMTQLLEQAVYAPGSGRFKVYMIDEVHMLTGHAFNAMLKTLEEPPPHVKFILATTDPQKIPVTVLSRCLQFNLKQMTAESMVAHLQDVLAQEDMQFETPALRLLAQAASGSMRDALSLTDQAIAYSAGNLTIDAVQGMLGTIDHRHLVNLVHALANGDAGQVLAVADELASRGLSYAGALADLAILLSRIAIQQRIPGTIPADDPQADDIAGLAECLHPDVVQLFYSVAVHSRQELSLAPDEYAGFVMACLRMLALVPAGTLPPAGPAASQPRRPESQAAASAPPAAPAAAAPVTPASAVMPAGNAAPAVAPVVATTKAAPVIETSTPAVFPSNDTPAWEDLPPQTASAQIASPQTPSPENTAVENTAVQNATPAIKSPEIAAAETTSSETTSARSTDERARQSLQDSDAAFETLQTDEFESLQPPGFEDVDEGRFEHIEMGDPGFESLEEIPAQIADLPAAVFSTERKKSKSPRLRAMNAQAWPALAASLPVTGLAAELARQSEWIGLEGEQINLRVAVFTLAESPGKARLCTVLSEHFGTVVQLNVEYGATGDETAHAVAQAQKAMRQQEAEQAVATDPFVQTLISEFGARVVPGSISAAPLERAA